MPAPQTEVLITVDGVEHSPGDGATLRPMRTTLRSRMAGWENRLDAAPGRNVWRNFRETKLTFEKSNLARLNYVHQDAVHHDLLAVANQYPWCSAAWFVRKASPAMVRTIRGFGTDRVNVPDDFTPYDDW